jgi:hypothetical protein
MTVNPLVIDAGDGALDHSDDVQDGFVGYTACLVSRMSGQRET